MSSPKRHIGLRLGQVAAAAALVMAGPVIAGPAHAATAPAATQPQALVLGDVVTGGASSIEATDAAALGFKVTVVDGVTWDAMTAAQFASYQLLIVGDPYGPIAGGTVDCTTGRTYMAAAIANAPVWGHVVLASGGNVAINGTDPGYHNSVGIPGATKLISASEGYAGAVSGATGAYVSLGCSDAFGAVGQTIPMLDSLTTAPAGTFKDEGLNTTGICENNIKIVTFSGPTAALSDGDLSGWTCSVHESFDSVPPDYTPLAIALDASTKNVCATVTGTQYCGGPYVLVRGGGITHTSAISLAPPSGLGLPGGTHTVVATVTSNNAPLPGAQVTFTVVTGPNSGVSGTAVTGPSGTASLTYTDAGGLGTDTLQATFVDLTGATETSNQVTMTWAAKGGGGGGACALISYQQGTPTQLSLAAKAAKGIAQIVVTRHDNATVNIAPFATGTTAVVPVTVTRQEGAAVVEVSFKVIDTAGTAKRCDAALIAASPAGPRSVNDLYRNDHSVKVFDNGLSSVTLKADATTLAPLSFVTPTATATVDISPALIRSDNSNAVAVTAAGTGTADVVIVDGRV
jgi:hypothetical protein